MLKKQQQQHGSHVKIFLDLWSDGNTKQQVQLGM
jgi:hypothetical protein